VTPAKIIICMAYKFYFMLCLLIAQISCGKKNDCEQDYLFEVPFMIGELIDSVAIGDSIYLKSSVSRNMIDLISGKELNLNGFNFGTEIIFERIDSNRIDGSSFFELLIKKGSIDTLKLNNSVSFPISYEHSTNENFNFELVIIPKSKGVYFINLFSLYHIDSNVNENIFSKEVKIMNEGCKEYLNIQYKMNYHSLDNNYFLIEESGIFNIDGKTKEILDRSGVYAFSVVE
jgi:hypothetical protein